jgi:hypothetical protein
MRKVVSISVLVVWLALPLAGPLLARAPCTCCRHAECELAVRATGGCCGASAIPDTTVPSQLPAAIHLAAPAVAVEAVPPAMAAPAGSVEVGRVSHTLHSVHLVLPLRI